MKPIQYAAGSRYSHPDPNAARHALKRPCSTAARDLSMLRVLTALEDMRHGRARREEWADLSDVVNVVEALCHLGKIEGAMPEVFTAQLGMVHAMRTHEAEGRMEIPEDAYRALRALVNRYQTAVERFSGQTFQDAAAYVYKRIAEHEANPRQDVVVVG